MESGSVFVVTPRRLADEEDFAGIEAYVEMSCRRPRNHGATSVWVQAPRGGHDATFAQASTGCRKARRSLMT